MSVKVGINGFGRIGRNVLRICERRQGVEVVAVNDVAEADVLAHLFKYDSVFGPYPGRVEARDGHIVVGERAVKVFQERDPGDIPWSETGAQVVVEASGRFRTRDQASRHLGGTVAKVVISAPAKGEIDFTTVMGINESDYDPESHHVLSTASCTTNCFAILVKVLHDAFIVSRGHMSTVHSYTSDQRLLDAPHNDLRRARAAALSMIPTSTGAARAIELVFPELKGKLSAVAVRVPTPDVSLVDFSCEVATPTSAEEVNAAFERAAAGGLARYLRYVDEPLVSCDFVGDPHSAIFDASLTSVVDGTLVKVLAWYDNEYGYSSRLVDFVEYVGARL